MRLSRILAASFAILPWMQPLAAASLPLHVFSKSLGSFGYDRGAGIATDSSGNVFCTGQFDDIVNFGGVDLVSAGLRDVFVAKYDAAGQHLWSRGFGSMLSDYGQDIVADAAGNAIVVGYCSGDVDFGGGVLAGGADTDGFVAKYDSAGNHLWSRRIGGVLDDLILGVVADAASNVILCGYFRDTIELGGNVLESNGGWDVLLAKFDPAGNPLWSAAFGSTGNDSGRDVAIDAAGNIALIGSFLGSMSAGGGTLVSGGVTDILLAKFDSAGSPLWSQSFGGPGLDHGYRVVFDELGNVVLAAAFEDSTDFGGGMLHSAGAADAVVAKYDGLGAHLWSKRFGASEDDNGVGIAVDAQGDVSLAAMFRGSVDFGGGALNSAGEVDVALVSLDAGGTHRWSKRWGGAGNESGGRVCTDTSGNVLFAGTHSGVGDAGGGILPYAGADDILLLKVRDESAEPVIRSILDVAGDNGRKVEIQFERSGHDHFDDATPVMQYEVYRRDDPLPSGTSGQKLEGWTLVAYVPTSGTQLLATQAPTLADSTIADGPYESNFLVRAATFTPAVYFDSVVASGHSLDNLAPVAPFNLSSTAGLLEWSPVSSPDFDYFSVYGGASGDFGLATLIGHTTVASMDVSSSPSAHYFVTATDFSGNESLPSSISAPTSVGDGPQRFVLSIGNHPNPFNPRTTIRYTVPTAGKVWIAIFDARGQHVVTLLDGEERSAGGHRLEWAGRTQDGDVVPSGIYHARILMNAEVRSRKLLLLK